MNGVIEELTEALRENTKVTREALVMHKAGGNSAAATAATSTAAPAEGKRGPGRPRKITEDEVKVVAEKVRDHPKLGKPAALKIINDFGAQKLANLDPSKYSAFIAACDVALKEVESEAAESEADEDDDDM